METALAYTNTSMIIIQTSSRRHLRVLFTVVQELKKLLECHNRARRHKLIREQNTLITLHYVEDD